MNDSFQSTLAHWGDYIFGWILYLPGDLALVTVALLTSLSIIVVRRFSTNQDLLGRCRADRKRLKELIREAKANKDKEALARYRKTDSSIGLVLLKAELKPLLIAILPMAFLATWAFERLDRLPLALNEPVNVVLVAPVSAAGKISHLVPVHGVSSQQGWLSRFEADPADVLSAKAHWTLSAATSGSYKLLFRSNDQSYEHEIQVGGKKPGEVLRFQSTDGRTFSQVELKERKLFGVVPGVPALGLAPWLTAYFALTILLVPASRIVLRVN